jgi:hypothetical protein
MAKSLTLGWTLLLGAAIAGTALAADNSLSDAEKQAGWELLFDGKTLAGWEATASKAGWVVEDGSIACLAKDGGYLRTARQYGDFELAVDYKIATGTNSGIFVRWGDLRDPVNSGVEIQVIDSAGKAQPDRHDDGAIYDLVAPSKNATRPAGTWNHVVITCRGPRIDVALNGEKIASINVDDYPKAGENPDGTRNKYLHPLKEFPRRGYVGLQDHGGRVWFKNLKLRPLRA